MCLYTYQQKCLCVQDTSMETERERERESDVFAEEQPRTHSDFRLPWFLMRKEFKACKSWTYILFRHSTFRKWCMICWFGGLLSHGGTPIHHPFDWDFPWNEPTSCWGTRFFFWKPPVTIMGIFQDCYSWWLAITLYPTGLSLSLGYNCVMGQHWVHLWTDPPICAASGSAPWPAFLLRQPLLQTGSSPRETWGKAVVVPLVVDGGFYKWRYRNFWMFEVNKGKSY